MEAEFYALLHLAQEESTSINLPGRGFAEQLAIYLDDAVTLARSLARHGLRFRLITNDAARLQAMLVSGGRQLELVEIPFTTEVPPGTAFYSAHFKLDVFRWFASRPDAYSVLLDADVVCINPPPAAFMAAVAAARPLCYEVTSQLAPAIGQARIAHDLALLHGMASAGRWYGGEFMAGPGPFFAELSREIDRLWGHYVRYLPSLHHAGDEMVTSAALECLERRGHHLGEAGALQLIARHWNSPTRHRQAPLGTLSHHFLLHLPGEKVFLSSLSACADEQLDHTFQLYVRETRRPKSLLRRYGVHLPLQRWWRMLCS